MIYKELQRKLKMEYHEPHTISRVNTCASERHKIRTKWECWSNDDKQS